MCKFFGKKMQKKRKWGAFLSKNICVYQKNVVILQRFRFPTQNVFLDILKAQTGRK